jgi:hypothetical protein
MSASEATLSEPDPESSDRIRSARNGCENV